MLQLTECHYIRSAGFYTEISKQVSRDKEEKNKTSYKGIRVSAAGMGVHLGGGTPPLLMRRFGGRRPAQQSRGPRPILEHCFLPTQTLGGSRDSSGDWNAATHRRHLTVFVAPCPGPATSQPLKASGGGPVEGSTSLSAW